MKTTFEIPDDIFRRAKAKAALEGIHLRDLVVYGLQLALETPPAPAQPRHAAFPLIRSADRSQLLTDAEVAKALADIEEAEAKHHADDVRR